MGEESARQYEFDVALSFAGEDRAYVEEVALAMQHARIRYFLDSEHLADTWGEDLVEFFDLLFRKRARYAVIFTSRHYATKMWPRQERRSALARAVEEKGAYILPVLLDDTQIDGFRPTVGHMDSRRWGIDRIVRELVNKLQGRSGSPDAPIERSPRDEAETQRLIEQTPAGWEYMLLGGLLVQGLAEKDDEYRDHEAAYSAPSGVRVREDDALSYVQSELSNARTIIGNWERLLNGPALARAIGEPGEPGDAERLRHLAKRMTSAYSELMRWAARIRGAARPDRYRRVFAILARFADQPLEQYRVWVREVVTGTDRVPAILGAPREEPVTLSFTLTLSIADDVLTEFNTELKRIEAGIQDDDDE
jgi:hypothetical protein